MTEKVELDTLTMCRICLQSSDDDNEMMSIYECDSSTNVCLYQKIEWCGGIKIIADPDLPTRICRKCNAFLTVAHKFRILCRNSDNYLREFVCKISTQICDENELEPELDDGDEMNIKSKNVIALENDESEFLDLAQAEIIYEVNVEDADKSCTLNQNGIHTESESEYYEDEEIIVTDDIQMKTTDDIMLEEIVQQNDPEENTDNIQTEVIYEDDCYTEMWLNDDGDNEGDIIEEDEEENDHSQSLSEVIQAQNASSKTLDISTDDAAIISLKAERKLANGKTVCGICGNAYSKLRKHMRKHTGERPYTCVYCKHTFTDRSSLVKHERIHRNERPYECSVCKKTFTYANALKLHTLIHTGEKPHSCEICGKRFSRVHHLRAHMEALLHKNDPCSRRLLNQRV